MFSIKSELNSNGRIVEGALQCYNYLLKENEDFYVVTYINGHYMIICLLEKKNILSNIYLFYVFYRKLWTCVIW